MTKQLAITKSADTRATRTVRWRKTFLSALAKTPSVKNACRAAAISRRCAYTHRKQDSEFAAAWLDAIQASVDELETRAFELAAKGDANLIQFLLRCHKPEIYRDRHEVGLIGGVVFLPNKAAGDE